MRKIKLIKKLLDRTGVINVVLTFILYTIFTACLLVIVEPGINTVSDALWLCFEVISTIGFGDVEVFSIIGRILVTILSLYSIFILALIPAIFVSYYMELLKLKQERDLKDFLRKIETLSDLSAEELKEIAEKAKEFTKDG